MYMDKMFPQAGIITSLGGTQGKAYIPLIKEETDWCPVAANLLLFEKDPLNIGDEVLVVFLNGDPHSPVISAKL